jgi:flavin reductase (DIM6/NTAB) family NADH-FMN oxidoreductase RutF
MTVQLEQKTFESRAFRRALGQFRTGVCVVTTMVDDAPLGVTVSSFNSLSLDPPLVLFSIDHRSASRRAWIEAEGYAVHVLAENQQETSDRFAKSLSKKWEGVQFTRGCFDAPILPGAAALFECAACANYEAGDHTLLIGEVRTFHCSDHRRPLVFSKGRYAKLHLTEAAASIWPLDIHY